MSHNLVGAQGLVRGRALTLAQVAGGQALADSHGLEISRWWASLAEGDEGLAGHPWVEEIPVYWGPEAGVATVVVKAVSWEAAEA